MEKEFGWQDFRLYNGKIPKQGSLLYVLRQVNIPKQIHPVIGFS